MAITRIGSLTEIETNGANTGSQSVSVPADAELMIVGVTGWSSGGAGYFSDGAITIAGATLTEVPADTNTSFFYGELAYKVSPATGTQTLAWDWEGTAAQASDAFAIIAYGFYKGLDTASPTRDTYGGQEGASPHATDTLTAVSGDLVIAWAFQYAGTNPDGWTMTNATEVSEFWYGTGATQPAHGVWAEAVPSGNVQITATQVTSGDGGMAAIVFKVASGPATLTATLAATEAPDTADMPAVGPARIAFVNPALGGTTTTTSFSITLPATEADDLIILEYTHRGTGAATLGGTYSGGSWTQKHDQLYATSTFSGKTVWSRATGNHTGQTVTGASLTNSCAAIVTIYRGALTTGDPLADATIVGEQNASGNVTQAAITTATDNAWVVLVIATSPDVAASAQACTSPGTLTERAEVLSTGGTDTSIAHASAEKATAGTTGAFTWTQATSVSGSWAYAIQPEPTGPPTLTATLAATEAQDTAVLAAEDTMPASLGATETADTAALALNRTLTVTLAATEAQDVAALTADDTMPVALTATDTPDVAALTTQDIMPASLAATELEDTAAFTAQDTMPAVLAATETPDVAALVAQHQTFAVLAATDTADVAALQVAVAGVATLTATLTVTETPDMAALVAEDTMPAVLAATELADTAALVAQDTLPASLVATEVEDTAALSAQDTMPAALAATDAADVAALTAQDTMPASLAATEAADSVAVTTTITHSATVSATEAPDTAALATTVLTPGGVTLAATEAPDTAALVAQDTMPASLAATEAADVATMTAQDTKPAALAVTEAADTAALTAADTMPTTLAATEAADTAALTAQDTLPAALVATEASDTAALTATTTTPVTRTITLAATEAPDSAAATAQDTMPAALTATEAADTAAALASVTHQAALAATEAQDVAVAITQLQHFMNLAATESPDSAELELAGATLRPPEGRTAPGRLGGASDQRVHGATASGRRSGATDQRVRGASVPRPGRGGTHPPRGEP